MNNIPKKYRPNVACIIINSDAQILACQRCDKPAAWQLPQGGIEAGETTEEALFREIKEELGTDKLTILDAIEHGIRYDWPEHLYQRGYLGQVQYYFLASLLNPEDIDLSRYCDPPEFSEVKWMDVDSFQKQLSGFKKDAYVTALRIFTERNKTLFKLK